MNEAASGVLGMRIEQNVEVPMRDGTTLRANVFRPDAPGRYPTLVARTPYRKTELGHPAFVRAGYAVVSQDVRGRYASDGEFHSFKHGFRQEGEDGYDTIEWAAAQPWSNGRVGSMGASYCALVQWAAAAQRPPSLIAMHARTIPVDQKHLDWPGAFRCARRVRWWLTNMAPDLRKRAGWPPPHTVADARKMWTELDAGRWLWYLPWKDLPRHLPPPLDREAAEFFDRPVETSLDLSEIHQQIDVPNLDICGWADHCGDSMRHLPLMQKNARSETAREHTRLIIGPGDHGRPVARTYGDIDFGPQVEFDMDQIVIQWFDHWLKGIDNGVDREPAVRYFAMGANAWREAETWPPADATETTLYLSSEGDATGFDGDGRLTADIPTGTEPADTYDYDPTDPMPTIWTPDLFTLPNGRRAIEHRRDVCVYRTQPLDEDLEIVGYPEVVLYAASSALDTDFFVHLVDEDSEGITLEAAYGMVRARHRNGLDREDMLTPDEPVELRIRMDATAIRFLKDHRIRLEITSSNYPQHDRNHNTGGDDLAETEMRTAHQTIHHDATRPSRLVMHTRPEESQEG